MYSHIEEETTDSRGHWQISAFDWAALMDKYEIWRVEDYSVWRSNIFKALIPFIEYLSRNKNMPTQIPVHEYS